MAVPAEIALERLREGNRRFLAGERQGVMSSNAELLASLADGQAPIAAVLGCADSRVAPEIILDQPIGALFSVRVAGNVAGPTQIDSLEYAVDTLDCRLVLVLGHGGCGAVRAAIDTFGIGDAPGGTPLESVIGPVRAAIATLMTAGCETDERGLERAAVRANVQASVATLRAGSTVLARGVERGVVRIVGAWCRLQTGAFELLDDPFDEP